MSFTSEGNFNVIIEDAFLAASQFGPEGSCDLVVKVAAKPGQGVDGQSDFWQGELSTRPGVGNNADKTQYQMTTASLEKLGIPAPAFAADMPGAMDALKGKETVAWVKQSGQYFNVRSIVSSGRGFTRVDPAAVAAQIAALAAGGGAAPAPQFGGAPAAAAAPTAAAPAQPAFPAQTFPPAAPAAPAPNPFG